MDGEVRVRDGLGVGVVELQASFYCGSCRAGYWLVGWVFVVGRAELSVWPGQICFD